MWSLLVLAVPFGLGDSLELTCTEPALGVKYDIKYYNGEVNCGSLLLESDIGGGLNVAPKVTFDFGSIKPAYYTLIYMDPDADLPNNGSWPDVTTPGSHAPVRHWVVGNIDHDMLRTGDFSNATIVSPFVGPSPPYGSHRYGQFLFRQPSGRINNFQPLYPSAIVDWNYTEFIEKYDLGTPVASNWHVTQHADPRPKTVQHVGADFELKCTEPALGVQYDIKYYNGKVNCGTLLLEADIGGGLKVAPKVTFDFGSIKPAYYTLIYMDPDADLPNNGSWPDVTTPGSHAPVRHWVVGNIDHDMLRTGDFSQATIISPFVGPSPPYGSHRYGQFLFRQPLGKINNFPSYDTSAIVNWNYPEFIEKYNLGTPVASNWHVTQHAEPRPLAEATVLPIIV